MAAGAADRRDARRDPPAAALLARLLQAARARNLRSTRRAVRGVPLDGGAALLLEDVDQNGRPVEPEVLAVVREALPRAVTEFTGGKLSAAAVETGTETRAPANGWITVDIVRNPGERQVCGSAQIGANPGTITLNNDVCSCGSNKIPGALVMHEVGHALGFFHVPERNAIMYPFIPGNCPPGQLSPAEKFHSAIAYTRPRGNRDPDVDPTAGQFLQPSQPIVVVER